jgi:hypothetical protein
MQRPLYKNLILNSTLDVSPLSHNHTRKAGYKWSDSAICSLLNLRHGYRKPMGPKLQATPRAGVKFLSPLNYKFIYLMYSRICRNGR